MGTTGVALPRPSRSSHLRGRSAGLMSYGDRPSSHEYLSPETWRLGGATIMHPSPRTSTPGPAPALLTAICGRLNIRWAPSPPVHAIGVLGSRPRSASRFSNVSRPPLRGSMSITAIPDAGPVAIPMFASGHLLQNRSISVGSRVASRMPFCVRGCLPGLVHDFPSLHEHQLSPLMLWTGTTDSPSSAYCK